MCAVEMILGSICLLENTEMKKFQYWNKIKYSNDFDGLMPVSFILNMLKNR